MTFLCRNSTRPGGLAARRESAVSSRRAERTTRSINPATESPIRDDRLHVRPGRSTPSSSKPGRSSATGAAWPVARRVARRGPDGARVPRRWPTRSPSTSPARWASPCARPGTRWPGWAKRARAMCGIAEGALADVPPAEGRLERPNRERAARRRPRLAGVELPAPHRRQRDRPRRARRQRRPHQARPRTPLCGEHFARAFAEAGGAGRARPGGQLDHAATTELVGVRASTTSRSPARSRAARESTRRPRDRFIDVGLELGGKDPAYVAEDSDFENAVENVVDGAIYNAGQSCCGGRARLRPPFDLRALRRGRARPGEAVPARRSAGPADDDGADGQPKGAALLEHHVAEARAPARESSPAARPGGTRPLLRADPRGRRNHKTDLMVEESFGPVVPIMPVTTSEALPS